MKKRFLAMFLALALCLGLAIPAFAADAGEATPVTVNAITLSEVVITDKYQMSSDEPDAPCYNLGMIRFVDDAGETEYETHNIYIVPDDATVTFHLSAGHSAAEVYAFSLKEDEPVDGVKAYTATQTGHIENQPFAESVTLDKDILDSMSSNWKNPTYNLLACHVSNDEYVWVMFESKTAALGEPIPPAPAFTDLLPWCEKEAVWAARQKITNGYGGNDKFAPGIDCTQVQILTFLWRAENKPASTATAFSKLAGDYAPAANWAYEKGMIDDSFNPNAPCTRSQAVSYIWQARGKLEASQTTSFSDVDAGAPYAGAVSWAVEKGVTKGYGGANTFAPDRVCSRGEIVCFLYRAYNN